MYWLEAVGFGVYSWLIGDLLLERAESGALALYTIAMALHFHVVDHTLEHEHGRLYTRSGRWICAAAVVAGWATSTTVEVAEALFAQLFAVIVGAVVITSLRAELPREGEGKFVAFWVGAAVYGLVRVAASPEGR